MILRSLRGLSGFWQGEEIQETINQCVKHDKKKAVHNRVSK